MNLMETTESIQCMFEWYAHAEVCYAFPKDLKKRADGNPRLDKLGDCRWFTWPWTLQELLAPASLVFYDQDYVGIGTLETLAPHIAAINIRSACLATRMSWISQRDTSKAEDIAYYLLGIFDVNMPFFYGEGKRKAFMRLQQSSILKSDDESMFAWDATEREREREQYEEFELTR